MTDEGAREREGLLTSALPRVAVAVNGEHFCTMGLEHPGMWTCDVSVQLPISPDGRWKPSALRYSAKAMEGPIKSVRMGKWAAGSLAPGDELRFAILAAGPIDSPARFKAAKSREEVEQSPPWPYPSKTQFATLPEGQAPRFEIVINGERNFIAGISGYGALNFAITYISPGWSLSPKSKPKSGIDFSVFAFDEAIGADQYLEWPSPKIRVGDEITIRILPPGPFDPHEIATTVPSPG